MPASLILSAAIADAMAALLVGAASDGAVVFYSNATARPARATDAVPPGSVELARIALGPDPEAGYSEGVVTMLPLGPTPWLATGRLAWGRVEAANGDGLFLGNVGTRGDEVWTVPTLDVIQGDPAAVGVWEIEVALVQESEDGA